MAKVPKQAYASILHSVRVEGVKVVDVASRYGCSAANIYHILKTHSSTPLISTVEAHGLPMTEAAEVAMMASPASADDFAAIWEVSMSVSPSVTGKTDAMVSDQVLATDPDDSSVDIFAEDVSVAPVATVIAPVVAVLESDAKIMPPVKLGHRPPPVPTQERLEVASVGIPKRPQGSATGRSANAVKPGFGLVMRGGDAEDTTMPFRSLDDLLSSVRNIMRTAARNPEPVWFSVQPINLSEFEQDS